MPDRWALSAMETLREVNMEARRRRILDTARQLVERGGVGSLSMRALGKEVGLSVTTLYNLYGSKEAILEALEDHILSEVEAVFAALPEEFDPIEQARMVMGFSAERSVAQKALTRSIWQGLWDEDGVSDRSLEFFARGAGMQEAALIKAQERGVLRPGFRPYILASQLFIGWKGAAQFWAQGIYGDDEFIARVVHFLVVSIMPFAEEPLRSDLEAEMRELETRLTPFRAPVSRGRINAPVQAGLTET